MLGKMLDKRSLGDVLVFDCVALLYGASNVFCFQDSARVFHTRWTMS